MTAYNDILVSVVMPVYNGSMYLREAIDSILSQTHSNIEFIIVNDGSTDDSEEIILSYDDPRICYLRNENNCGICVTLNKGLDVAKGKYIARMDCDDVSMNNRIAMQVEFMETHLEIGICGCDVIILGNNQERFVMVHDPDICTAGLIFNPCFAHPTVLWRKSIMDKFNLRYDNEFKGLEDYVMWWKFAEITKLTNIPLALLKYRIHGNQETQNRNIHVLLKSNLFRKYRYQRLGLVISSKELNVLNNYSYGYFEAFTRDEFFIFISIMKKIIKCTPYPITTTKKAVKVVIAKAVGYIISQSPHLRNNRAKFLITAFLNGTVPMLWLLKFLKSYI